MKKINLQKKQTKNIFEDAISNITDLSLPTKNLKKNKMFQKFLDGNKLEITTKEEWYDFLTVITISDHELINEYTQR